MRNTKNRGDYGETVVLGYLKSKGYDILKQNFKAKGGEIDIIAQDGDSGYIVFVEVKYRRGTGFGDGLEAVNFAKQRRLIAAAKAYLYAENKWDVDCRFDVISLFGREEFEVEHIENAFWES